MAGWGRLAGQHVGVWHPAGKGRTDRAGKQALTHAICGNPPHTMQVLSCEARLDQAGCQERRRRCQRHRRQQRQRQSRSLCAAHGAASYSGRALRPAAHFTPAAGWGGARQEWLCQHPRRSRGRSFSSSGSTSRRSQRQRAALACSAASASSTASGPVWPRGSGCQRRTPRQAAARRRPASSLGQACILGNSLILTPLMDTFALLAGQLAPSCAGRANA